MEYLKGSINVKKVTSGKIKVIERMANYGQTADETSGLNEAEVQDSIKLGALLYVYSKEVIQLLNRLDERDQRREQKEEND